MHISVEPGERHVVLHLRGEFDTYYCHLLDEEIEQTLQSGIQHVVLNLRLVKFINRLKALADLWTQHLLQDMAHMTADPYRFLPA
ncbi:MAG: STAS domain-containing protein [Planctomycetota bacterium]